ncbi:MAG: hypothetical protein E7315_06335 [Clostridiales bacterium]|nr:hypothetical protein [Clostridiales bacterium]
MLITSIKEKSKYETELTLDDGEVIALTPYAVSFFHLYVEKEISGEELSEALEFSKRELAKHLAMKYISYAAHTKKQILDHLKKLEIEKHYAQMAVDFLTEHRYVDDAAYATRKLERSLLSTQKSSSLIMRDIAFDGVSEEILEEVFEKVQPNDSLRAQKIIDAHRTPITNYKELNKLKAKLYRNGYDFELINELTSGLLDNTYEQDT